MILASGLLAGAIATGAFAVLTSDRTDSRPSPKLRRAAAWTVTSLVSGLVFFHVWVVIAD